MALQQHGIETYLPESQSSSASGKKNYVAFSPGYLFMRVDLQTENDVNWRWVPGVYSVVAYGEKPVPLPDEFIDVLKCILEQWEVANERATHRFREGDVVLITQGPFSEMLAIFSRNAPSDLGLIENMVGC